MGVRVRKLVCRDPEWIGLKIDEAGGELFCCNQRLDEQGISKQGGCRHLALMIWCYYSNYAFYSSSRDPQLLHCYNLCSKEEVCSQTFVRLTVSPKRHHQKVSSLWFLRKSDIEYFCHGDPNIERLHREEFNVRCLRDK